MSMTLSAVAARRWLLLDMHRLQPDQICTFLNWFRGHVGPSNRGSPLEYAQIRILELAKTNLAPLRHRLTATIFACVTRICQVQFSST
jgi:hypothetical protein